MDAATAGVIGAAVGALAGIIGAIVTNVFAARRERDMWRRTQMVEGYARALNHLTRAAGRRSHVTAEGTPYLSHEDVKAWFLDLADAEHSLAIAAGLASPEVRDSLVEALGELTTVVREATSEGKLRGEALADIWDIQAVVARGAVIDLGRIRT